MIARGETRTSLETHRARSRKPLIREAEVLRYVGYSGQEIDDELAERVRATIAACEAQEEARACFRIFEVDRASRSEQEGEREGECGPAPDPREVREGEAEPAPVRLRGATLALPGSSIAEYAAGARYLALLACTLGMRSERELRRLSLTDPLGALIYGSACSDLVERGADECEAAIVSWAHERGLHANFRYSPGYGDLPLSIQPEFVRCLGADRTLGMSVTRTNLLVPTKSITAIVGIYPERPASAKVGCAHCNCREFCSIRRSGTTCYASRTLDAEGNLIDG